MGETQSFQCSNMEQGAPEHPQIPKIHLVAILGLHLLLGSVTSFWTVYTCLANLIKAKKLALFNIKYKRIRPKFEIRALATGYLDARCRQAPIPSPHGKVANTIKSRAARFIRKKRKNISKGDNQNFNFYCKIDSNEAMGISTLQCNPSRSDSDVGHQKLQRHLLSILVAYTYAPDQSIRASLTPPTKKKCAS